jgi:hypothetical protein
VVSLTSFVFRAVRGFLELFAKEKHGYERRDRVMALYAPLALLILPVVSLLMVFGAFMCIYVGLEQHGWRDAYITSGSSLLTLGFERPPDLPSTIAAFVEASIGLGLLALLIAYLPTIYGAFSRREIAVTDLAVRAGTPPSAPEMLLRAHLTGFLNDMDSFWESWMNWFTELGETHTSLGVLAMFRSPNPNRSWITASGVVLDAAALRMSILNIPWSSSAPLCIRSGYLALREIAGFFGYDYEDNPAPDDPISIARSEFDEVYEYLASRGLPVRPDRERAWRDFAGWRVNYDQVLHAMSAFTMAPYAPWVSDRSPRRPADRYSYGRRRAAVARRVAPR